MVHLGSVANAREPSRKQCSSALKRKMMPRSKKEAVEAEAKQPENVAARALSHRAKEDLHEFYKRLATRFMQVSLEELKTLLPHLKPYKPERGGYGYKLAHSDRSGDATLRDVMQGALHEFRGDAGWDHFYTLRENEHHKGEFDEWMLRARIFALAQGVLAEEEMEDGVAEGRSESGSED